MENERFAALVGVGMLVMSFCVLLVGAYMVALNDVFGNALGWILLVFGTAQGGAAFYMF